MFAKCEMQLAASFKGGTELHRNGVLPVRSAQSGFPEATGYKVDILGSRMKDASSRCRRR